MVDNENLDECKDPTQTITIELPCAMAERVDKLAEEKKYNVYQHSYRGAGQLFKKKCLKDDERKWFDLN